MQVLTGFDALSLAAVPGGDLAAVPDWASTLLGAVLIFLARVADVSLGTMRTLYVLRGRKLVACSIGAVESLIFILAISSVLAGGVTGEPYKVAGYVLGYATGIYFGLTIEQWIASGWSLLRVIDRENAPRLIERLRSEGIAVTSLLGEGRDGPTAVAFVVVRRKRTKRVLQHVREVAPQAFVTHDNVGQAINGTLPGGNLPINPKFLVAERSVMRK